MGKAEKLLKRFLSRPRDLTFEELEKLLMTLGYERVKTGKTAGSRITFYNEELDDIIKFHKPHPSRIMKQCYLREIERQLKDKGVIK